MSNEIVNIEIKNIYQHPDNPRKNLGDLSELTESIRKNGVMQNLTVIPGHHITDEEWSEMAAKYKKSPTEELREKMNTIHSGKWLDEGYTLIIGHRRCAASKAAGLETVPCMIVENMEKKAQISTMLEENMQRNDLTIWEQANGFQMMLDLGETEETIAEKTGFSKTTVRHRLNIAKLNQKVLQKKEKDEGFQLALSDLYALEQVEDIKTRDKILREASNSRDLVWKARGAAEKARRNKVAAEIIKLLEDAGIQPAPEIYEKQMYSGKWETMESFSLEKAAPKRIIKKKVEGGMYYKYYREVRVVKKKDKPKEPETEWQRQQKQKEKNAKTIKAIAKEMAAQREDFVRSIMSGKIEPLKETEKVMSDLWRAVVYANGYFGKKTMAEFLLNTKKSWYNTPEEDRKKALEELENVSTLHQLMIAACVTTQDLVYMDYNNHYKSETGEAVMAVTRALNEYGFSYSDDEQNKVMEGSHEYYVKEVENAKE